MNHSMDSYSSTTESLEISKGFQTINVFKSQKDIPHGHWWSIKFRAPSAISNSLNKKILNSLEAIAELSENWDEEGALKPDKNCVQYARAIILYMDAIGQEIYAIVPGPNGEIMLDFRDNKKSFEIILYKDVMRYVKFGYNETPEQGIFTPDVLFIGLVEWLNTK